MAHTYKRQPCPLLKYKKVVRLEYEAYSSMALRALTSILVDVRHRFASIIRCAVSHRLGNVQVEEASGIVAVSSPHRKQVIAEREKRKINQRNKDGPVVEPPPVPLQIVMIQETSRRKNVK